MSASEQLLSARVPHPRFVSVPPPICPLQIHAISHTGSEPPCAPFQCIGSTHNTTIHMLRNTPASTNCAEQITHDMHSTQLSTHRAHTRTHNTHCTHTTYVHIALHTHTILSTLLMLSCGSYMVSVWEGLCTCVPVSCGCGSQFLCHVEWLWGDLGPGGRVHAALGYPPGPC